MVCDKGFTICVSVSIRIESSMHSAVVFSAESAETGRRSRIYPLCELAMRIHSVCVCVHAHTCVMHILPLHPQTPYSQFSEIHLTRAFAFF